PPLPRCEKKQYDEVVRTVFGRLRSRLEQEPAQWEGWLYFHTYFSPAYRASLDSAGSSAPLEKAARYFIQETSDDRMLVDKQTYKQYRVNKKEEAQLCPQKLRDLTTGFPYWKRCPPPHRVSWL